KRGSRSAVFVACQHGNESKAALALASIVRGLSKVYRGYSLHFIPVANPDGLATGFRLNACLHDLNRNWRREKNELENKHIIAYLDSLRPSFVFDIHCFADESDRDRGEFCIIPAGLKKSWLELEKRGFPCIIDRTRGGRLANFARSEYGAVALTVEGNPFKGRERMAHGFLARITAVFEASQSTK
ncbi:MAG: succinylglutamate desuccinylase/aspartoacylase family protein, partial [Candidatus Micrarchaeota archaeon]